MEHLRAGYTEVWVRSEVVPLIGFADHVRSIASTGIELLGIPGVEVPASLETLTTFDDIVTWYGSNRPEFRAALGSFGKNINFLQALPPQGVTMHSADFFLTQTGGHGEAVPSIDVGPIDRHSNIVFHPFSGSPRKNWPMERFLELERELGGVEWAAREDAVRFENLKDLARWLAGARVYVGNDSGITHLAAAAGARVVALFGPTDPDVWGPRGKHVKIVRARSMEEITVRIVANAIAELLEQSRWE